MLSDDILDLFRVPAGKKPRLHKHRTDWAQTDEMAQLREDVVKDQAKRILDQNRSELAAAQELLYADNRRALLVILQGMDASGKDGTIKHVMSGVNPQGCQVFSFKQPSAEELDHTFLWRYARCLPERGRIGIFNRSHYEDVLVVKVHPESLDRHRLSKEKIGKKFWRQRYDDINAFERHLSRNGTLVLKFFLNISPQEQGKRLLDRLSRPEKQWKFSIADLDERDLWERYQEAYEDALSATSTEWAPWHVIPADHKWVARALVVSIITKALRSLDLRLPEIGKDQQDQIEQAKQRLLM